MIGEKELSYRVSRWAFLGVLVLGVSLVGIPARGQETGTDRPATNPAEQGDKAEATTTAAPDDRDSATGTSGTDSIDPAILKLGEAAEKRLSTYSDVETLTLKDGETGRMKVKKNLTPVAEILVTPHFVAGGTKFEVEGVDAEGEPVKGVRTESQTVRDRAVLITSKGLPTMVDGRSVMFKIQLTPWSQDDGRVVAEVKVLLTLHPTPQEMQAMSLTRPKPSPGQQPRLSIYGKRPYGNCSIGGRVVSAATGMPLSHAQVLLYYPATESSIFVQVADDGTFLFKDIPPGPYMLRTTNTAGYQNVIYNPEGASEGSPKFTLVEGEQRLDLVLKAKPAYRISGKIRDADGVIPEDPKGLSVSAWFQKDGRYQAKWGLVNPTDSSYVIDGLDDRPIYVMATNRRAAQEGKHFPPVYYPSTFSRSKAKQIVFGDNRSIEDVDITLRTDGGLTLEGRVVDEEGRPVPEALVLVHRSDMQAGSVTTYTDDRGQYRAQGLGDGEFLAHVDAAHRGYVRTRSLVDLADDKVPATCDFTLTKGVLISGRLVNEEGSDWQIDYSFGFATIVDKEDATSDLAGSVSNKYAPVNVGKMSGSILPVGEGGYGIGEMIFPTKSTFAIHGMMPGHTKFQFEPKAKDQEVLEIRYDGRNIKETRIETKPGDEMKDVTIVIGKE